MIKLIEISPTGITQLTKDRSIVNLINELVQKHTHYSSMVELVHAPQMVTPAFFQDATGRVLADIYDSLQEGRGDRRRATRHFPPKRQRQKIKLS